MNAEVVAIRHVHFEDLGSFEQVLGERGRRVRYVDVGGARVEVLDALEPSLLVVLGGPISAYDDELYPTTASLAALVGKRIEAGLPTLGVCLGSQLVARALGARVYPAAQKELGWIPLTLTDAGRASPLRHVDGASTSMLHWHGDTFDLPAGAILLASTPTCRNQAFSWGTHVLALQCHPEIRADRFEPWLIGHAGEIAATPGTDAKQLREQTARLGPTLECAARSMFGEWLDSVGL
ncbi:glutamine amidotransferase [Burkholderia thailandensis]|uniref:Glutamine amidotransferase class-I domain protein, putative n=1 Tax=Burkholderia thailandensis (strain ATCC 700388 / DSM 13276 / CCUG 48851 / CIP 106301 / E264) TaxID=271848 RepID=Q2STB4_BURTA|nr:glutamine amidotransferase [Burkholderia thailandensis]ABC38919.1 glutamine amidotransferase class-I domain protein, putative [Burkholderia thailandensis E264]AHI73018.1 peptidase C26 family protein [Burkholderia thailandensis 2002721723]AHI78221.1 peptidase C26 family protein [Burkholderia thailandensis E444]AIC86890.1 peptidase C26 family protein [Burkholderia thailandensis USAMRU Malaysia \